MGSGCTQNSHHEGLSADIARFILASVTARLAHCMRAVFPETLDMMQFRHYPPPVLNLVKMERNQPGILAIFTQSFIALQLIFLWEPVRALDCALFPSPLLDTIHAYRAEDKYRWSSKNGYRSQVWCDGCLWETMMKGVNPFICCGSHLKGISLFFPGIPLLDRQRGKVSAIQ